MRPISHFYNCFFHKNFLLSNHQNGTVLTSVLRYINFLNVRVNLGELIVYKLTFNFQCKLLFSLWNTQIYTYLYNFKNILFMWINNNYYQIYVPKIVFYCIDLSKNDVSCSQQLGLGDVTPYRLFLFPSGAGNWKEIKRRFNVLFFIDGFY